MKKWYSYFLLLIGILGILIFMDYMISFTEHDYFYIQNPGVEKYVGVNVVSRWANFCFFTYHTLIIFSGFCILQFIGNIFKIEKLNNFLYRKDVLTFITTNYIITSFCYTIFELTSGNINFGLYANTLNAWYSFITNIIVHYLFFFIALINYLYIKTNNNFSKKSYLYISIYLLLYFITVKLTGMYCYKIIWYPYPIFDSDALSSMMGLMNIDNIFSLIFMIIVNVTIYLLYFLVYNILKCLIRHNYY